MVLYRLNKSFKNFFCHLIFDDTLCWVFDGL
jgi:hypothetical protein